MKTRLAIIFFLFSLPAHSQYYLRGDVKDERSTPLPNVKIIVHSTGYVYYSGSTGGFGIMLPNLKDSVTFTMEGYQPLAARLDAKVYQNIILKPLYSAANTQKKKLLSFTKNLRPEDWRGARRCFRHLSDC